MRRLLLSAVALPLIVASLPAHARDAAVEGVIDRFIISFNRGDMAGAAALHVKTPFIVDEFAPFWWSGPDAFSNWAASEAADAKTRGLTDEAVVIGMPTREKVNGDNAYVIVPATYRYKERGVPTVEHGQLTFALQRQVDGWKIASWTWSSPEPTRGR